MPVYVNVIQGDSIASLAYQFGFAPDTIWNYGSNSALKTLRKDPNLLYPGDVVVIPDKDVTAVSKGSDAKHSFQRRGVPSKLEVRFMKNDKPRKSIPYQLQIDDSPASNGSTDGGGWIRQPVKPNAKRAILKLMPSNYPPEEYELNFSHLDPLETVEGVKGRLVNLGYAVGEIDGDVDDDFIATLKGFQRSNGLPDDGAINDETRAKLKELHQS